jgi:predicted NBD/HSP70 family sugar kinase
VRTSLPFGVRTDRGLVVAAIQAFVDELMGSDELAEARPRARLIGVGVAVGGHVQYGEVCISEQAGWGGGHLNHQRDTFNLQDALANVFDVPVLVENDITAFTVRLVLREHDHEASFAVVCVLADGIGGGLVLNGRTWHGVNCLAMEPARIVVDTDPDEADGIPTQQPSTPRLHLRQRRMRRGLCGPGRMIAALAERISAASDDPASAQPITTMRGAGLLPAGDEQAAAVFRRRGGALGKSIANIINIVDPGKIYLYAQPELLRPARDSAAAEWLTAVERNVDRRTFTTGGADVINLVPRPTADLETGIAEGAASLLIERLIDQLDSRTFLAGFGKVISG